MSKVGNIYVNTNTNKTYECTAVITVSPTLINERETVYGVYRNITGGSGEAAKTIVLEDENGNKVVAVLVDEEVDFTATANDIREGKIAATDDGVTVGEKYIPSYETWQGTKVIPAGQSIKITSLTKDDCYDYTKFQAIICLFNTNISNSVSTEIVSIDDNVYNVQSTESISVILKDHDNKSIDLGITNNFGAPCIIRFITYKEVE